MRKVSTKVIADKTNMTHWAVIRTMCDMVTAGTLKGSLIPLNRNGDIYYERQAHLPLADFIALAVHMRLPRTVTDEIARIYTRVESDKPPMVQKHVDHGPLVDALGTPELIAAIKSLRDETVDAKEIAGKYGLRRVGDMLWIGTSTPYIAAACKKANLLQGQLSTMLARIPGTLRHGTKKFNGRDSKVIAVPIDALLELLEGSQDDAE